MDTQASSRVSWRATCAEEYPAAAGATVLAVAFTARAGVDLAFRLTAIVDGMSARIGAAKKILAPGECWRIRPIDQDREACARRMEEGWDWVRLGRGRIAHRSGDARMGSDRAEAPGARVWPKTAR